MTIRRPVLLLVVILLALILAPVNAGQAPRNVILMIGDGMGVAQVALTRLSLSESSPPLAMDSMRYAGFVKTYSADSSVTDSAAAATALATGFKTNNGMVGVLPDGTPVRTILESAAGLGKAAGLVATSSITGATPAGFGSHVPSRGDQADIAVQYVEAGIDVLLGSGRNMFIPRSEQGSSRKDDRDLLAEARSAGYAVLATREDLLATRGPEVIGFFQDESLTAKPLEPNLAEMTEKAIEILSEDSDGFFLMVEGAKIDSGCHANDAPETVRQVFGLDAAIGKALAFARSRGDTLVIVTADHETGGLAILGPSGAARFRPVWATAGHSACTVPIFADGPGADAFSGVLDNTDVPKQIARLWGIGGFGGK